MQNIKVHILQKYSFFDKLRAIEQICSMAYCFYLCLRMATAVRQGEYISNPKPLSVAFA